MNQFFERGFGNLADYTSFSARTKRNDEGARQLIKKGINVLNEGTTPSNIRKAVGLNRGA